MGTTSECLRARATKAPISDAKVDVRLDERRVSSETKTLQPMAIGSAASYGNYIKLKRKNAVRFTVKIQKPIAAGDEARLSIWCLSIAEEISATNGGNIFKQSFAATDGSQLSKAAIQKGVGSPRA